MVCFLFSFFFFNFFLLSRQTSSWWFYCCIWGHVSCIEFSLSMNLATTFDKLHLLLCTRNKYYHRTFSVSSCYITCLSSCSPQWRLALMIQGLQRSSCRISPWRSSTRYWCSSLDSQRKWPVCLKARLELSSMHYDRVCRLLRVPLAGFSFSASPATIPLWPLSFLACLTSVVSEGL